MSFLPSLITRKQDRHTSFTANIDCFKNSTKSNTNLPPRRADSQLSWPPHPGQLFPRHTGHLGIPKQFILCICLGQHNFYVFSRHFFPSGRSPLSLASEPQEGIFPLHIQFGLLDNIAKLSRARKIKNDINVNPDFMTICRWWLLKSHLV